MVTLILIGLGSGGCSLSRGDAAFAKMEDKDKEVTGSIGPALTDIKSKYPDRAELVAILVDATQRNPLTVMPPFGRNRILNDKEINAIVDFLQTL